MAEAVFEDTPLAEYLTDVGIEDWGIEETPRIAFKSTRERDRDGLLPLVLDGTTSFARETRFRKLIKQASRPHLPTQETSRFLEQFRYAIVTSQLLESRPIFAGWSNPVAQKRRELLFSESGPWDLLKMHPKFCAGGGCVFAVAILTYWSKLKDLTIDNRDNKHKLSQSSVTLLLTILVALYVYSHSRRRLIRKLRAKALGYINIFVEANKIFDGDCINCLKAIQQTELVNNGYIAGLAIRQASGQLESRTGQVHTCRKLRAVLSSALYLASEAYLDAIKDCFCICSEPVLQQYYDVYDLTPTQQDLHFVMNDDFIGFTEDTEVAETSAHGGAACYTTLTTLKQQFRKVHFLRRVFLCCLLAAPSSGQYTVTELESWTVITDQLRSCGDLLSQLSTMITKERFEPKFEEPDAADAPLLPQQARKEMFDLNVLAQNVAAKTDIVYNSRLERDELLQYLSSLKDDVSLLQSLCGEIFSRANNHGNDKSDPESASSTPESQMTEFDSLHSRLSITTDESWASTLHEDNSDAAQIPLKFEILEGVASAKASHPRSKLTREERIQMTKEKRASAILPNSSVFASRDSFLVELGNVLRHRNAAQQQ